MTNFLKIQLSKLLLWFKELLIWLFSGAPKLTAAEAILQNIGDQQEEVSEELVSEVESEFPTGVILKIEDHPNHTGYKLVYLGKKDADGNLVKDYVKVACIEDPESLDDMHQHILNHPAAKLRQ